MGKKRSPKKTAVKSQSTSVKTSVLSEPSDTALMFRRIGAFIIDWYVGGAIAIAPVLFTHTLQSHDTTVNVDIFSLGAAAIPVGLFSLVILSAYFYIIPWKLWAGQTLGQRLLSVAIVGDKTDYVTPKQLFIRQVLVLVLLETPAVMTGSQVLALLGMIVTDQAAGMMSVASCILLAISTLLCIFTKRHQALHDQIAHTRVIYLPREKTAF